MRKVIECADWNGVTGSFDCKAKGDGKTERDLGGTLEFPWVFLAVR